MAKAPVKRVETVLDPTFFIPEGVDEYVYDPSYQDGPEDEGEGDIPQDDTPDAPEVPDEFTIISQTIRGIGGGKQVVDVVAEVPVGNNVVRIEYRLTKVDG